MLPVAKVGKNKPAVILALLVPAILLLFANYLGREDKREIKLAHTKLPPAHKPVYIGKITFGREKETYPVGLLAANGNLLVTYYNREMVDVFSLGGRKLGGFKVEFSGQKGFPYTLSAMEDRIAITDFVNGAIGFYELEGVEAEYQGSYTHNTAKDKLAPLGVFAMAPYYYAVDKNFRGWLVLDAMGKLVKMVPVKGEDKIFKLPGQGAVKRKNLVSPYGIIVTADKRMVLSDQEGAQIKVYDSRGKYLYDFEKPPANNQLLFPRGMALDGHGRIHVVDKKANKVFAYDNYGKFLFTYGDGQLLGPSNITVDESKRVIYVANTEKQEISVWGY